jgi:hypothetical protein
MNDTRTTTTVRLDAALRTRAITLVERHPEIRYEVKRPFPWWSVVFTLTGLPWAVDAAVAGLHRARDEDWINEQW